MKTNKTIMWSGTSSDEALTPHLHLLAFVDTHGNNDYLNKIKEKLKHKSVDYIICAGDFTIFERDMAKILKNIDKLATVNKQRPTKVLLITGNHESRANVKKLTQSLPNTIFIDHGTYITIRHCKSEQTIVVYAFMGFGDTSFKTSIAGFNSFIKDAEKYITGLVTSLQRQLKNLKAQPITRIIVNRVLVLHAPPYGTKLDLINHNHLGIKEFSHYIKKYHPKLVICGHFHENFGKKDKLNNTLIINPGPKGQYLTI